MEQYQPEEENAPQPSATGSVVMTAARIIACVTGAFMLLAWCQPAAAATFNVTTPAALQSALSQAAANGEDDTVSLAAGVYALSAPVTFSSSEDHSLTIAGAGAGTTFLDGGGSLRPLLLETTAANAHITLRDVTVQNGLTPGEGAGLNITTGAADIILQNCVVQDNSATGGTSVGGGASLFTDSGTAAVTSCLFRRNSCSANVGGLYVATTTGSCRISRSTFSQNTVDNTGGSTYYGDGGGAMFYADGAGTAHITHNTFSGNRATGGDNPDGGGLMTYQLGAGARLTLANNTFTDNYAGLGGGGCILRYNASCTLLVQNNAFTGNETGTGSGAGAMLYVNQGDVTYENNTHQDNQAGEDGGGAWLNILAGTAAIKRNTFSNNQAGNNGGGLSATADTATFTISGNILARNTAGNVGGGLSYATGSGSATVQQNTWYANTATSDGGGLYAYLDTDSAQTTLRSNILRADTPNAFAWSSAGGSGAMTMTCSDIQGGSGEPWFGTGCIDTDPLFADAAAGNFALTWANFPVEDPTRSPCIDTGDPASPRDPDGTVADMGALFFDQRMSGKVVGMLLLLLAR